MGFKGLGQHGNLAQVMVPLVVGPMYITTSATGMPSKRH